jgi:hypothetical protein
MILQQPKWTLSPVEATATQVPGGPIGEVEDGRRNVE